MLVASPLTSKKSDEGHGAKVIKTSESDPAPEKLRLELPAPFALGLTRAPEEKLEPMNDNEDENEVISSFMRTFEHTLEGRSSWCPQREKNPWWGWQPQLLALETWATAEVRSSREE